MDKTLQAPMEGSQPLKSILLLLSCGAPAVFLIPNDVDPIGALRWPAILLAVGLIAGPLWASRRNLQALLRAEHVLAFAPVFWLLFDPIQATYPMPGFSSLQIRKTFAAIILFSIAGWIGASRSSNLLIRRLPLVALQEFSPKTYFLFGLISFGLAFLSFAIPSDFDVSLMFSALLEDRWNTPWSRGQMGGWDAFSDHLAYFGYILPLLTIVLARKAGWLDFRTLAIGLCSFVITLFLAQGGNRRIIGVMVGSAIVFWFLTLKRVRRTAIILFLVLTVSLGVVLNSILEIRTKGLREMESEQTEVQTIGAEDEDLTFLHVDDNFLRVTQVIAIFPGQASYTTWRYPLWVAVRPVPRVFWPNKPVDPGFDLADFLGMPGVSLSTSVIGELFACGGFLVVGLGGLFYGRVAAILNPLRTGQHGTGSLLLYSAGLLALFAGFRSMIELVLMSYMLLIWIVLCCFRVVTK